MVTAVTFLDRKWPHLRRDNDVVLRAHVGRSDDTRWSVLSDDDLTGRVSDELLRSCPSGTLLRSPRPALAARTPQYFVGHEQLVQRARNASKRYGVALAGNATTAWGCCEHRFGTSRRARNNGAYQRIPVVIGRLFKPGPRTETCASWAQRLTRCQVRVSVRVCNCESFHAGSVICTQVGER